MNNSHPEDFQKISTEDLCIGELEELDKAFPNLDIYSQCSSYDPTESMAEKPFFKDGIKDHFTEACPARWTSLTCVVSPGPNPLPAEVCIKHNPDHPKEFFCLDQADWQYSAFMNPHMYSDPIQEAFRKVILRTLIQTFNLFKYHLNAPSERYLPCLPKPIDSCVDDIIAILKAKIDKFIEYVEDEAKDLQADPANAQTVREIHSTLANFNSTCAVLNVGTLAHLILDTTHAFRANKNWNSHGSTAASAVLQLGSVLASLQNANRDSLDLAHMEMIPKGEMQTGAKHGNHHVSYVEYMCGNCGSRRL